MSIDDKTILVTGDTGSFGRKFVEIALTRYNPRRIIVFSRDELKQREMGLQFNYERLAFSSATFGIGFTVPSRLPWI